MPRPLAGRDTSVDSPNRIWDMKGAVRYDGQFLEEMGAHVYFGGIGKPDGPGHGHGYIDKNNVFRVFRDPYDPSDGNARQRATSEYVPAVKHA